MIYDFRKDDLDDLKSKIQGKKSVFTNGCFDILHVGHLRYLKEAQSLGDYLIVGVNSDRSVKDLKGPSRPVVEETERAEMLAGLKAVDAVVIFDEDTPKNLIENLSPNVLCKGGDWAIEDIVGSDHVIANGGQVKSLMLVPGRSTTNLFEKLQKL